MNFIVLFSVNNDLCVTPYCVKAGKILYENDFVSV